MFSFRETYFRLVDLFNWEYASLLLVSRNRYGFALAGYRNEKSTTDPALLSTILDPRYKCLIAREILTQDKVTLLHGTILKLLNETEAPRQCFKCPNKARNN